MSILSLIKPMRKQVFIILLFSSIQAASSAIAAFFTAKGFNYLIEFEFRSYFLYTLLILISISVGTLASYMVKVQKQKLIQNRSEFLRLEATQQAKDELNKNEHGFSFSKYVNMTTIDIVTIESGLDSYFDLFHYIVLFIFSSIALLAIHYTIFFVTIFFSILMVYAPKKIMNKIGETAGEVSKLTEDVQKNISNWLQGLAVLRSYGALPLIDKVVKKDSERLSEVKIEQAKSQGQVYGIGNTVHILLAITVEFVAAYLAYIGLVGFGTILAVGNLSSYLSTSLHQMNNLKSEVKPTESLLKKYSNDLDNTEVIYDSPQKA